MAKSKAIVELELKYKLRLARLDVVATVARSLFPSTAAVAIAWLITHSIDRLAGKFTYADIGVRFISDFKVTIAYTLTGLACVWAVWERREKGNQIRRLSVRVRELEKKIDPGRSSSHLSDRGTTRPGDE